jgi:hypothetical protein
LDFELRKKPVKCYNWSIAFCGAETWSLGEVDQKYLESFETWCWRRIEISWPDHMKYGEMLQIVQQDRNILHTIKGRKVNWSGHIFT